ncbi:MAG: hypothetical protein HXX80_00800 [Nitrososphaerales archaeon]|nr:hypothetical protein [Nitrososphaerales archaeon]
MMNKRQVISTMIIPLLILALVPMFLSCTAMETSDETEGHMVVYTHCLEGKVVKIDTVVTGDKNNVAQLGYRSHAYIEVNRYYKDNGYAPSTLVAVYETGGEFELDNGLVVGICPMPNIRLEVGKIYNFTLEYYPELREDNVFVVNIFVVWGADELFSTEIPIEGNLTLTESSPPENETILQQSIQSSRGKRVLTRNIFPYMIIFMD